VPFIQVQILQVVHYSVMPLVTLPSLTLVLGFPLTYLSLTNIGDIVFDNNFYKDSFNYTINSSRKNNLAVSTGFAACNTSNQSYYIEKEIGWQTGSNYKP
jgi:hypothetical protein